MFSDKDIQQIIAHDLSVDEVQRQIEFFENGFPYLQVLRPATIQDGIVRLSAQEFDYFTDIFDMEKNRLDLIKFVPASGAATRMFKSLIRAKNEGIYDQTVIDFFEQLDHFAFYPSLKSAMGEVHSDSQSILTTLLTDVGLDYQSIPKGLLKFHFYPDGCRTPVEEHMVEGALYSESKGFVRLHFTVAPEFESSFRGLIYSVLSKYQELFNVKYEISFSVQKTSTDTIAVNPDNTPFRLRDGRLLFRPAGHGALLDNINNINADIIFIKNIDNVVPDRLKSFTVRYKKALAGLLLCFQKQIFDFVRRLDDRYVDELTIDEASDFVAIKLCSTYPEHFNDFPKEMKRKFLMDKLNRPLRVCGLVLKTGESGGGPFWVAGRDGSASLQLVESSQMDLNDPHVASMLSSSTHFNPVDLICSIKDYKGEKFDLLKFRDPFTGFISQKSHDGENLKAQELPGLWNGSMSYWNTVFVEVPISTFNPVKCVNDLLRDEHLFTS